MSDQTNENMLILPTDTVVKVAMEHRCSNNNSDSVKSNCFYKQTALDSDKNMKMERDCSDECFSDNDSLSPTNISNPNFLNISCQYTALVTESGKLYVGIYDGEKRGKLSEVCMC